MNFTDYWDKRLEILLQAIPGLINRPIITDAVRDEALLAWNNALSTAEAENKRLREALNFKEKKTTLEAALAEKNDSIKRLEKEIIRLKMEIRLLPLKALAEKKP